MRSTDHFRSSRYRTHICLQSSGHSNCMKRVEWSYNSRLSERLLTCLKELLAALWYSMKCSDLIPDAVFDCSWISIINRLVNEIRYWFFKGDFGVDYKFLDSLIFWSINCLKYYSFYRRRYCWYTSFVWLILLTYRKTTNSIVWKKIMSFTRSTLFGYRWSSIMLGYRLYIRHILMDPNGRGYGRTINGTWTKGCCRGSKEYCKKLFGFLSYFYRCLVVFPNSIDNFQS